MEAVNLAVGLAVIMKLLAEGRQIDDCAAAYGCISIYTAMYYLKVRNYIVIYIYPRVGRTA